MSDALKAPAIAIVMDAPETVDDRAIGVCMDGRYRGWLMKQHPDGQWVTLRKLQTVIPQVPDAWAKILGGPND